ncbi:MAG: capsule biosynthesis protein [Paracoccus sp. (in: a-proteobacteria)]|uniref:capsule biosynthesis protein n=1 Tax=Paracoccus sp. TaxID=267 RepID=UPI0026E051F9|nr:capsule biosynthesis protein [Paracoccus sp. (in: a-proteobacteria)]MDO5621246.1 capsule biosynthesis protein [Paracoccus sp. (in: a-proteobacteria)]
MSQQDQSAKDAEHNRKNQAAPATRPVLTPRNMQSAAGTTPAAQAPKPAAPQAAKPPAAPSQPVRPPAAYATGQTRHRLLALSFLIVVILPTLISAWYLWMRAEDRYISTVAFSVRKESASPSMDMLGGLTAFTGDSSASDTDVLYDFLRSEDVVARIDQAVDLRGKFSKGWPRDRIFAFDPNGTIEDLTEYWQNRIQVLYDTSSRIITLNVSAYTPEDARDIAQAAFDESSSTINRLSDIAREDTTRFARAELTRSQQRLTETRQALTGYRIRSQIVDPAADLAGQMGVLGQLQSQLAEALVAYDTLRESARENDPRAIQARQRIDAIRSRIAQEREKFSTPGEGPGGESYAQLLAEYERLASDMEFAEAAFRSAQASYDTALAEAQRQSRYLAAHIEPRVAQASLVPDRPRLLMWIFVGLVLGWAILLLIYYSIRDRR